MNGQLVESRKWSDEQERDVLDVLSQSDAPALATDATGHVVFWNHAGKELKESATKFISLDPYFDHLSK